MDGYELDQKPFTLTLIPLCSSSRAVPLLTIVCHCVKRLDFVLIQKKLQQVQMVQNSQRGSSPSLDARLDICEIEQANCGLEALNSELQYNIECPERPSEQD